MELEPGLHAHQVVAGTLITAARSDGGGNHTAEDHNTIGITGLQPGNVIMHVVKHLILKILLVKTILVRFSGECPLLGSVIPRFWQRYVRGVPVEDDQSLIWLTEALVDLRQPRLPHGGLVALLVELLEVSMKNNKQEI